MIQNQMQKQIKHYLIQDKIGEGGYCKVYKAIDQRTNQMVAIKFITLETIRKYPELQTCYNNEIQILCQIDSPLIVRLIEYFNTPNELIIVYEYCNSGTLEQFLERQRLDGSQIRQIMSTLIDGLHMIHSKSVLHRDIKPENILFHNGQTKIADFGFSKQINSMTQSQIGSPNYMAPEILNKQQYNTSCDIWSLGVMLYRMVEGKLPYQANNIQALRDLIKQQQQVGLTFHNSSVNNQIKDLIRRCLQANQSNRITIQQLKFQFDTIMNQGSIKVSQQPSIQSQSIQQPSIQSSSLSFNRSGGVKRTLSAIVTDNKPLIHSHDNRQITHNQIHRSINTPNKISFQSKQPLTPVKLTSSKIIVNPFVINQQSTLIQQQVMNRQLSQQLVSNRTEHRKFSQFNI